MALSAIEIQYWEDHPQLTEESGTPVFGKMISTFSGALNAGAQTLPGNCTFVSVLTNADAYLRFTTAGTAPGSGAQIAIKANQKEIYQVGPQTAAAMKLNFAAA